MKPMLLALLLPLCGCTVLNSPKTGKPLLFTTANSDLLEYSGDGVTLRVVNQKHERAGDIIAKAGAAGLIGGAGL